MTDVNLLTPSLLQSLQRGDAILFLGTGASAGAMSKDGSAALKGDQLRDHLAAKFLGGELKTKSLSQVAEYAKSASDLLTVQQFINALIWASAASILSSADSFIPMVFDCHDQF